MTTMSLFSRSHSEPNPAPDGDSVRPLAIGITIFLTLLATLVVGLRAWARKLARAPFKVDDHAVLVALLLLWTLSINCWIAIHYGVGQHIAAVGVERMQLGVKAVFAHEFIYSACVTANKIALLLLYYRIFTTPTYRRIFIQLGIYVTLWCLGCYLVLLLECRPISYFWNRDQPGRCGNQARRMMTTGVLNVIFGFMVLISPIPCIWSLSLRSSQKVMISGIFLLGGFVTVASIIRLCYIDYLVPMSSKFHGFPPGMWCIIEPTVGLICVCLPVMRPLLCGRRKNSTARSSSPESSCKPSMRSWPGWKESVVIKTDIETDSASWTGSDREPTVTSQA